MAAVTRYAIIMNHCSVLELLHGTIDMTTQLPTAAAGVSGDHSSTLSELHHMMESVPVIMYSLQLKMTCVMCWLRFVVSTNGRSLDCN